MREQEPEINHSRKNIFFLFFYLILAVVAIRLFYWQIIMGKQLKEEGESQTLRKLENKGLRGQIFTNDDYLLVGNQRVYDLKLDKKNFEGDSSYLAHKLAEIAVEDNWQYQDALESQQKESLTNATSAAQLSNVDIKAIKTELEKEIETEILGKFESRGNWPKLADNLSKESREKIETLNNPYLFFDEDYQRFYPEASMAAHLTGFVGRDENANEIGRYGIEGALEDELKARSEKNLFKMDALGFLLAGQKYESENLDGRDITLTIRRDVQNLAEQSLEWGIEHYEADRGEVIILDSKTGKILALAAWPSYKQWQYFKYSGEVLKNPSLTRLYEPGSTFKTLTISAGIDSGVITKDTTCTKCSGPRQIAGYSIRTWNDVYNPNISMVDGYAKSDNTAMIFISDLLGTDRLIDYLKKFGIGRNIDIDLQDDTRTPFPQKIGPVETATISFGQGISTNSLELLRAVNTVANQGKMLEPIIVEKVFDKQNQKEIASQIKEGEQVISKESAKTVTEMMIEAALHGEAQWIASDKYTVAAKTGTSQVPDPNGGYKEDETIASFIGFAPASNPRFTMLVKLENTKSSPWAAETAAPLWYKVADKLMILLNITPDK
ncbi:penicillin-binding protein 2 [Patescibacteria group bacterium]|nr:penicillin-binding protein 2 [Patescibacteria group bacterium]